MTLQLVPAPRVHTHKKPPSPPSTLGKGKGFHLSLRPLSLHSTSTAMLFETEVQRRAVRPGTSSSQALVCFSLWLFPLSTLVQKGGKKLSQRRKGNSLALKGISQGFHMTTLFSPHWSNIMIGILIPPQKNLCVKVLVSE